MDEIAHPQRWPELAALMEPTDAGRRLDVGGFILGDTTDTLLRHISADFLRAAWERLDDVLKRHGGCPDDLTYGWMHPGETFIPRGMDDIPCRHIGWTSRKLARFDLEERFEAMDAELGGGFPRLCCAVTWRSLKWRIQPTDHVLGLRLFEAFSTDEISDWNPDFILTERQNETEPWVRVAIAIRERDQNLLDVALTDAEQVYSAVGYRIVVRGYQMYSGMWAPTLRFPRLQL